MDNQQLRTLLEKLQTELQNVKGTDLKEQELLQNLRQDVEGLLEHADEDPSQRYQLLSERLAQAIQQFEVDHPELTWTMSYLTDLLSRLGL